MSRRQVLLVPFFVLGYALLMTMVGFFLPSSLSVDGFMNPGVVRRKRSAPSNYAATTTTTRIIEAESTTALAMHNKKRSSSKSKSKASSGSKGFGGGGGGSATLDPIFARFPFAGSIRPGKQSPQRVVASSDIVLPDYALDGRPKKGTSSPLLPWVIEVKRPDEIEKMRAAGKLAREILDLAGRTAQVGVTTDEIDAVVHDAIVEAGAYPSPLNYHGTSQQ